MASSSSPNRVGRVAHGEGGKFEHASNAGQGPGEHVDGDGDTLDAHAAQARGVRVQADRPHVTTEDGAVEHERRAQPEACREPNACRQRYARSDDHQRFEAARVGVDRNTATMRHAFGS